MKLNYRLMELVGVTDSLVHPSGSYYTRTEHYLVSGKGRSWRVEVFFNGKEIRRFWANSIKEREEAVKETISEHTPGVEEERFFPSGYIARPTGNSSPVRH